MSRFSLVLVAAVLPVAAVADDKKADPTPEQLRAEVEKLKQENAELRKRNAELTRQAELALKDAAAAGEIARKALLLAEERLKKIEELATTVVKMRVGNGWFPFVLPQKPPTLAVGARGQVNRVIGDQLELDIGLDAGLEVGMVVDVYRVENGGKYLGTAEVMSTELLFPKRAILTFTPANKKRLDQLKPGELPRKGDEVRPTTPAGKP